MKMQTERKQVSLLSALAGLSLMTYMLGAFFVAVTYSQILGSLMLSLVFVSAVVLAYRERSSSNEKPAGYWFRVLSSLFVMALMFYGITAF